MWSVGGSCDTDSREKFSECVRELLSGKSEDYPPPESVGRWDCPMHEAGLVYDYCYEVLRQSHHCFKCGHFALIVSFTFSCLAQIEGKGRWVHWNDSIERVSLGDKNTKIQDIIVPTIDTVRYSYLMDLCINYEV